MTVSFRKVNIERNTISLKDSVFWIIKMITPIDHDSNMDESNNNFLNVSSNSSEQQHNSGLTKAELRKVSWNK